MLKNIKRFRKGTLTDVLFLMFTLLLFVVVMRMQLEFSSVETIESYAQNTINSEFNTFVDRISGFSTNKDNALMFNNLGNKREFSKNGANKYTPSMRSEKASSLEDNSASIIGIMQYAEDEMKNNIIIEFNDPNNTWGYKIRTSTSSSSDKLTYEDIKLEFIENSNSTIAKLTVTYKVNVIAFNKSSTSNGFSKNNGIFIKRKISTVRVIENPHRFNIR